eukprot:TRINITY_DN11434_c0_g1_i1.p1 TRINITY_DN11434_c0_g1~~TRINITY_DN11434_c0_g1_i1.p1  ORF type:complete len:371 (-),score=81.43 TRINITY_DN11434_c0_g1_i1:62-1090(-)
MPAGGFDGMSLSSVADAFKRFDKDGHGRVSLEEVKEVLMKLGMQDTDANAMLNAAPSASDGEVDLAALFAWMGDANACTLPESTSEAGKQLYDAIMAQDEVAALNLIGPPVDVHAADFKPSNALEYKDPETGANIIFAAAAKGLNQLVGKLLAADAPVNSQNKDGWNCLLVAAHAGHLEVVRQLLEAGADKTTKTSSGDNAVELARKAGHSAVVEMLTAVDGRNLFNALMMKDEKTAAELIKGGADIHWKEAVYGADAILVACNRGLSDSVRVLIEAGGNVNSRQSFGFTCLICAAYGGYLEIARQLLQAGADKTPKTNDGATALEMAEKAGHTDLANLLRS